MLPQNVYILCPIVSRKKRKVINQQRKLALGATFFFSPLFFYFLIVEILIKIGGKIFTRKEKCMRRLDNDRLLHKTLLSICLDRASNVQHCASSIFCGSRALFTRPASTLKKKNNFKTRFHSSIHTSKNYFTTIFSIFNF